MAEELPRAISPPTAGPVGFKPMLVIIIRVLAWLMTLIIAQYAGVVVITTPQVI
jgi:hypothetical protein